MAEQESIEKPRRKRKVLQALVVLLVIIIAGFVVFRLVLKLKVHARLDAIRADGYPVTCAELDKWYTIPETAENAADTIIDSFSHYEKWEEEEKRKQLPIVGHAHLPLRTEPLAQDTKALITEYLAGNEQALELLRKGAAIEYSRYPCDFTEGYYLVLPHLSNVRTGAKMLILEAALHAENDKPDMAIGSVRSIFGLGRSLSKEPSVVSQLVRNACLALAVSSIERAINMTEFTDVQLVSLSRILANSEDLSAMTRAFVGEQCGGLGIFKAPCNEIVPWVLGRDASSLAVLPIALYKFTGLADMDAIIYLDLLQDYIESTQLPLHERQNEVDAIEAKIVTISKMHILLHIFMPEFSRVTTIDIRTIAQLRTTQAGLAIERYRLATGKLPDTLADLMPTYLDAVPKDPFDGKDKDLRYKKLETGFVVYSIGEDENDDGGKEKPRKRTRPPAPEDVTFIVQR
ncbi:MAG: hypothetical protein ACYS32_15910 [Planctomycetota bacterium]|jgi:hypothetical protein